MAYKAVDVAVIGGGPGGLAAAVALKNSAPKLKVAVFERAPALSRRGAGLGLDVNGQKALRAIEPGLHAQLLQQASFLRTERTLAKDGSLVRESPLSKTRQEYEQQGYKTPCLLGWYEVQQLLLHALPESTGVHLGAEFDHYEQDAASGQLTVHFRGGQRPVTAGLLVAADGYFSRVRRQAVGDGPPAYGNTVVWRARLPAASAVAAGLDLQDSSAFVQDVGRFLFAFPISSGDYVWTVGVTDDKLLEQGLDPAVLLEHLRTRGSSSSSKAQQDHADSAALDTQGYSAQDAGRRDAARARCLQAMAGFSDSVLGMIAGTPGTCLVEHGIYVRPAAAMTPAAYGSDRVVVMGDAAHPLRPTGQGLNQAMEDAWGLGAALAGAAAVAQPQLEALQRFRQQRAQRMRTVVGFTTSAGEAAYKAGGRQEEQAMTPAEFFQFVHQVEFESLGDMQQQAAAGAAA